MSDVMSQEEMLEVLDALMHILNDVCQVVELAIEGAPSECLGSLKRISVKSRQLRMQLIADRVRGLR